jgi:hypothetical protein
MGYIGHDGKKVSNPLDEYHFKAQLFRYTTADKDYTTRMQSALPTLRDNALTRIKDMLIKNPRDNYFQRIGCEAALYDSPEKQVQRNFYKNFYNTDPQLDYLQ